MFTDISAATYKEKIASAEAAVVLCAKPLCPHCKNMEKVLEKFAAQNPGIPLYKLNVEQEEAVAQELGAGRAPTLLLVKAGKIVATKVGLMNPKEFTAFYTKT